MPLKVMIKQRQLADTLSATRSSVGAQGECSPVWCVYFLERADGDVYVGSTNDLKRPAGSHRPGEIIARGHLPFVLKSYIAVETEAVARELEQDFKSGSGKALANRRLWQV